MQKEIWEKEYRDSKLITGYDKPQAFFLKFLKNLKKGKTYSNRSIVGFGGFKVLDLGSGMGRNANYLAQRDADVVGLEISDTALGIARNRAKKLNISVNYLKQNIGSKYPFEDESFDLVVDVTSSNSLNEKERKIYLKEVNRVLKKDGTFFVRTLCKDGDKNVKYLLKNNPSEEKDTYIMPITNLVERVFSEKDFNDIYSKYFEILDLKKTESYSTVGGRIFKRKFWLAIMKKAK